MPTTTIIDVRVPYPIERLRRGARWLSEKSANRSREPLVAQRLRKLRRLVKSERQCRLKLGDALVELIDRFELRPVDLARELKERANHLSEMYHVAKLFPPVVRQPHVPYTHYWATMRTVKRFRGLNLDPMATLREIAALGLTQHRHITAHFAAKMRIVENATALRKMEHEPVGSWLNRCHHADFRNFVDVIPNGSVKIISADPPYGNYRRVRDGRYSAGSMARTACDNQSGAEAIKLTVDLLGGWREKLVAGGVLLLWQAAGPLRKQIANAIEKYDWEVETVAIWDKGSVQPGNFETPYSVQTEWLWVLKRAGDKLINHDNSRRGDILRFPPVHRLAELHDRVHAFEKPLDLCRFLIGKHSYAGEAVVDLCACTGSMAVAAVGMGRSWAYVESREENFKLGLERLNRECRIDRKIAV
jgi:DNA modification methylase